MATFAVGFVARPVGGVVMGHFGDRVGRKAMLVVSLMTMGVGTTLIGFIPTYETIGVSALILLVVLRLAQGAGVGGEWAGAVLMVVENAPPKRKSLYGCFPQLGLPTGILLSQLVFLVLTGLLPPGAFAAWGWRIAFLTSAVLIIVGLIVRLKIEESTDFERVRDAGQIAKLPVVEVFRRSPLQLLVGSLTSIAAPALGYFVSVYMVSYGTSQLKMPTTTMLWIIVGVSVLWIAMMLAAGIAGDRAGRKPDLRRRCGDRRTVGLPDVHPGRHTTGRADLRRDGRHHRGTRDHGGPQPALITEMFPIRLRYSGASICYTVGSILGGGITPILATALFARFGSTAAVSTLIAVASLISLLAILLVGRRVLEPGESGSVRPAGRTAGERPVAPAE